MNLKTVKKMSENRGLIHIITGDGKGKTTAATGLAARAKGAGFSVLFLQFLKGRPSGEVKSLEKLDIPVYRGEVKKFVLNMTDSEKEECKKSQNECFNIAKNGNFDMIVFDELAGALATGMLFEQDVLEFLDLNKETEIVMTGRGFPEKLIEKADYISEIKAVRHPYDKGIPARKGIEF